MGKYFGPLLSFEMVTDKISRTGSFNWVTRIPKRIGSRSMTEFTFSLVSIVFSCTWTVVYQKFGQYIHNPDGLFWLNLYEVKVACAFYFCFQYVCLFQTIEYIVGGFYSVFTFLTLQKERKRQESYPSGKILFENVV